MRANSQDSRHRFRFIKQTDSNGRRWGRENKAENWMRLTRQMSPRIMFINGVYSKWHCALMLTLSWLLMCSLWWPTWEISNALNIHTLLCVWRTFNGLVKDFGVFSVRRCPELIWGRPGRSLGGPMIFRCSQSPKLAGVWKCPISSASEVEWFPGRKKAHHRRAAQEGLRRRPGPSKLPLSTRFHFLFLFLCQVLFDPTPTSIARKEHDFHWSKPTRKPAFSLPLLDWSLCLPWQHCRPLDLLSPFSKEVKFWKEIASFRCHIYLCVYLEWMDCAAVLGGFLLSTWHTLE